MPPNSSRNCFVVEHGYQPAHRAHEAFVGLAPVHVLGPVNGGEFLRQAFGENLSGSAALFGNFGGNVLALGRGDSLQLRNLDARLAGEGLRGRRRLTVFICDVDRRSIDLLDDVSLRRRDASGHHRQAPWRIEMRDFAARQALAGQQSSDAVTQFLRGRRNHPRRNLFASDL